MERSLLRSSEGFTLLELTIALALGAVVLLTSSNLLVNYAKYTSNFVKSESTLMIGTLAAFEEIVDKINFANKAFCGAALTSAGMDKGSAAAIARPPGCSNDGKCIMVRLDNACTGAAPCCTTTPCFSPTDYTGDKVYTYWLDGSGNLCKAEDAAGTCTAIATNINTLTFTKVDKDDNTDATYLNTIRVQLGTDVSSGVTSGTVKESLDTTVVMRGKSLT